MTTVSLKEARKRLGELVRAAEQGESIVLTRRGREVARIEPPASAKREGLPDLTAFRATLDVRGKPLSEVVVENRERERY